MNNKIFSLIAILCINIMSAQNVSTSQAINILGKQCMLSQRVASKKVSLSGLKKNSAIKKETTSSIIQFEQNLSMLNNMTVSSELHKDIKTSEMLWIAYKQKILNTSDKSNIGLLEYNNIVLSSCKKIQKKLYKIAENINEYPFSTGNTEFVKAYKATNDVKYLSQKLSLVYNIYYYKYSKYNKDTFNSILEEIEKDISAIVKMKGKNIRLSEKIDSLEYEWKNLQATLYTVIKNSFISEHNSPKPETITKSSNDFLKNADLLIREYKSTAEIND